MPTNKKEIAVKPTVVHKVKGDGNHEVTVTLNVHLTRDDVGPGKPYWFAQGLELDYFAEGHTVEEVKHNFVNGLMESIAENIKIYGNLDKFVRPAPQEAWIAWLADLYGAAAAREVVPNPKPASRHNPFTSFVFSGGAAQAA